MQATELLELFKQYYSDPQKFWQGLFDGLKTYSFENYQEFLKEMSGLKPQCKLSVPLEWQKSNLQTKYLFGPPSVKADVENFLRFSGPTEKAILIRDSLKEDASSYEEHTEHLISLCVSDIWHNWEKVAEFIRNKATILSKCHLYGQPHCLNQMTANKDFLESITDILDGFVNTDMPAFCKTSLLSKYEIPFNDQMINWKTGLNFYTCSAGCRHFLPIFLHQGGKCHNLINIINRMGTTEFEDDDLFQQTGPFKMCSCGSPRCEFTLVPHSNNFLTGQNYDELMALRNSLNSRYRWIQFIERNGIQILYQTSGSDITPEDRELISDKLPGAIFKRGEILKIGVKCPCFWKPLDTAIERS